MDVLMHICCGPCAVYPGKILKQRNIEVTGYFFNPNIHPIEEFERREENAVLLSEKMSFDLITDSAFQQEFWETSLANEDKKADVIDEKIADRKVCHEKTGFCKRCEYCYDIRMKKAFEYAKENGFSHATSSLLVSPYQNHELIRSLCEKYSKETGVDFLYIDFREGFREGQAMAKEMGLYRQKYCGCILS